VAEALGQLADSLHLLGPPQLLLHLAPLGHVGQYALQADDAPVDDLGIGGVSRPAHIAGGRHHAALTFVAGASQYGLQRVGDAIVFLRMHKTGERLADHLVGREADDRRNGRASVGHHAVEGDGVDHVAEVLDQRAVTLLAPLQVVLRVLQRLEHGIDGPAEGGDLCAADRLRTGTEVAASPNTVNKGAQIG